MLNAITDHSLSFQYFIVKISKSNYGLSKFEKPLQVWTNDQLVDSLKLKVNWIRLIISKPINSFKI